MRWRKEKKKPKDKPGGSVFRAPPGYRDSGRPIFGDNEVVSSTYQIRELLYTDGTGQVYEAWDMLLERSVAIKASWRDEDVPPLLEQARPASSIGQPCVASVFGMGNHHNVDYLVVERITGMPLTSYIGEVYQAGSSIAILDGIDLLLALARGLDAVHSAGYAVVRLSGDNIIIGKHNRLVFSNYALNQGLLDAAPSVFAPEVITSSRVPMPGQPGALGADLYALGCIAVELLTGKPPYPGDTLKAIKFAHVHHRPPQLSMVRDDVPAELGDLIVELLAKQPELRPANLADVIAQLEVIRERASAAQRAVRVLVVDDDPERVRPMWSVLRRAHSRVIVDAAVDSDEAAEKLKSDKPDVLLLNLELPGNMNGLELCMYFMGIKEGQNSTIVALTSSLGPGDISMLKQIGISHVLRYDSSAHGVLTKLVCRLAEADSPPPAS